VSADLGRRPTADGYPLLNSHVAVALVTKVLGYHVFVLVIDPGNMFRWFHCVFDRPLPSGLTP